MKILCMLAALLTVLGSAATLPAASEDVISAVVPINATTRNQMRFTPPLVLARAGKPALPIVISPGASPEIRLVANELALYLERISGASFVVEEGAGSRGIVLGTLQQFPQPSLDGALRINGFEGREAYAIRKTPSGLVVLGATDLGVSNGVYRMLAELGCYWLTPNPDWEIVPRKAQLEWDQEITDRPQVVARSIWWHSAFGSEGDFPVYRARQLQAGSSGKGWSAQLESKNWRRRNNHHSGLVVNAGHNWHTIILNNRAEFEKHEEYWPLINGVRVRGNPLHLQPDIGNPAVRQMFHAYARDYFTKNPRADMVSLDANDGGAFSQSPEFKALGTISDAVFGLANEVARMLQREFPGKMVGVLAYREHSDVPSFKLEPNVHVQFTGLIMGSRYTREQLLEQWAKAHTNMGFYDYYAAYEWYFDQLPGANASNLTFLRDRIREEVRSNAVSVDGQSSNSWILLGPGHWVANRLLWNPNLEPGELLDEYLRAAYGPAATQMGRFYNLIKPENEPIISKNLIYALYLQLQEARVAAKADASVQVRLDDVSQYLRFLELDAKLKAVPITAPYEEREQAFIALFTHIYRTRFSYSTHYFLAAQFLWQTRAEKAGLVLVKPGKPKEVVNKNLVPQSPVSLNPWKQIDRPYNSEESAANFASGLKYFEAPVIEEKEFSQDIVSVKWEPGQIPEVPRLLSAQWYVQGTTVKYALFSPEGAPIMLNVRPGVLNGNSMARPYRVRDAKGFVVAEGEIHPNDPVTQVRTVQLDLPAPGQYTLEITDTGAGFLWMDIPADVKTSIFLKRSGDAEAGPASRPMRYLYIPRGTREIQYLYKSWNNKHRVLLPDGKVLYEGPNTDGFHKLQVPEGMDGKVWGFDVRLGQFWPANFPRLFALTPQHVMVPRELAVRDGLKVLAAP